MSGAQLHVLVVDDSAVVRQFMTAVIASDPLMRATVAGDPIIATEKMRRDPPDVILLDLELPRMDGLSFLRHVMSSTPVPVVICSSLAADGSDIAVRALEEGAVDILAKPALGVRRFLQENAVLILDKLRAAANANLAVHRRWSHELKLQAPIVPRTEPLHSLPATHIVAIGASTGGTDALQLVLSAMPTNAPGIVVTQHMPAGFTHAFAKRLNTVCAIEVREAQSGDRIREGCALIAPGNRHLVVRRSGPHYDVELLDGPLVSRHRPSVDVLFASVAAAAGRNATGVILTGMGEDGAAGLVKMRKAGAHTIAQDEASCVVFGMPRAAIVLGGAQQILPLDQIATALIPRAQPAAV